MFLFHKRKLHLCLLSILLPTTISKIFYYNVNKFTFVSDTKFTSILKVSKAQSQGIANLFLQTSTIIVLLLTLQNLDGWVSFPPLPLKCLFPNGQVQHLVVN